MGGGEIEMGIEVWGQGGSQRESYSSPAVMSSARDLQGISENRRPQKDAELACASFCGLRFSLIPCRSRALLITAGLL